MVRRDGERMIAVICDMDGVLLDTERVGMTAWMAAAGEQGLVLSRDVFAGLIGLDGAGTSHHLRQHGWEDEAIERLQHAAWAKYLQALERDGVPLKPGVFELLDFLDARSLPRAVATSTRTDIAEDKLERVALRRRFQTIVGGDQVSHGKPAPDIYLRAATLLGCDPASCVAIEDSGPGIRAAAAAGMTVIWVPDLCDVDPATQALPLARVSSLFGVITELERLLQ
jgi:HAD superfamily hydrolase (TIGR01509 family)